MSLTATDLERIADLAQLELQPQQRSHLLVQMNDFFRLVEKMRAVDCAGIEPMAHPLAGVQEVALRLRDDVASEPDQRTVNQRNAPALEGGLFLVPKVLE